MQNARTLWRLETPMPCPWALTVSAIEATHIKFVHLAYEIVRDDQSKAGHRSSPAGYLYALFAFSRLIDGIWTEIRDMPGLELNLDVAELTALATRALPHRPEFFHDLDMMMFGVAEDNGLLPPGILVTENDIVKAF